MSFERARQHVVNAGPAVGRGRPFEEDVFGSVGVLVHAAVEDVALSRHRLRIDSSSAGENSPSNRPAWNCGLVLVASVMLASTISGTGGMTLPMSGRSPAPCFTQIVASLKTLAVDRRGRRPSQPSFVQFPFDPILVAAVTPFLRAPHQTVAHRVVMHGSRAGSSTRLHPPHTSVDTDAATSDWVPGSPHERRVILVETDGDTAHHRVERLPRRRYDDQMHVVGQENISQQPSRIVPAPHR